MVEGCAVGECDLGGLRGRAAVSRGASWTSGGEGVGLLEETWVTVGDTATCCQLLPTHRTGRIGRGDRYWQDGEPR